MCFKYGNRLNIIWQEREECKKLLRRAATEYGLELYEVEVDQDHVHLYIQIPPQRSVGRAVGILKSVSAQCFSALLRYFTVQIR